MTCTCGCGNPTNGTKKFISGHNLRCLERTEIHRKRIGDGQRAAWLTKRKRSPVGSKYKDVHGYIRIKVIAGKGIWPLEHIAVVEKRIGRKLHNGETVHHIDGDRANNVDSNLYLCTDNKHHQKIENQLRFLFRELLARGVVRFNPLLGVYECH